MDPSRTRQKMLDLYKRLRSLLDTILNRAPIFAGYLYEQKSRCGKAQCKCAKGSYRHRMWCVSFVEDGKSRTRVVPKGIFAETKAMTDKYAQFRKAQREIRDLFQELLAAAEVVAQARSEQGKKRYDRLVQRLRKRKKQKGG